MKVSFEAHKIIKFTTYNTVSFLFFSFSSNEGVGEVMVKLQLIGEIINGANSMCILFSVKHRQTLQES